jgi:hypothetical protein
MEWRVAWSKKKKKRGRWQKRAEMRWEGRRYLIQTPPSPPLVACTCVTAASSGSAPLLTSVYRPHSTY